jgi:sirohydrochlorin cobaltochelatase
MTATALILFAHGARDPLWARPFEAVAADLSRLCLNESVRTAYLGFMRPGLVEAAQAALTQVAQRVCVVPLCLGAGGHVRKEWPLLQDKLRANHTSVHFELESAIGEREEVIRAIAQAIAQAHCAEPAT